MGTVHSEQERRAFRSMKASEYRLWPTPAERRARELLGPLGFEFQVSVEVQRKFSVNGYILDCLHRRSRLCVEVDGGAHRKHAGADGRRDRALKLEGITTIRFS